MLRTERFVQLAPRIEARDRGDSLDGMATVAPPTAMARVPGRCQCRSDACSLAGAAAARSHTRFDR